MIFHKDLQCSIVTVQRQISMIELWRKLEKQVRLELMTSRSWAWTLNHSGYSHWLAKFEGQHKVLPLNLNHFLPVDQFQQLKSHRNRSEAEQTFSQNSHLHNFSFGRETKVSIIYSWRTNWKKISFGAERKVFSLVQNRFLVFGKRFTQSSKSVKLKWWWNLSPLLHRWLNDKTMVCVITLMLQRWGLSCKT